MKESLKTGLKRKTRFNKSSSTATRKTKHDSSETTVNHSHRTFRGLSTSFIYVENQSKFLHVIKNLTGINHLNLKKLNKINNY